MQRLVDIEKKLAEGKGRGYEHWATMHNLKQMAATLNVYQEYGFTSPEQLEAAVDTAYQEMRQTSGELKALETKLKEKYHHVRLTVGGVEAVSEKIVSPGGRPGSTGGGAQGTRRSAPLPHGSRRRNSPRSSTT